MMSRTTRTLFLAGLVILAAVPVWAQSPDVRRGSAVARETCAGCHAVRKGERSPNPSAPAFEAIAAVPGMTSIALRSVLQTSHREMPNIILSADDRMNVIAYILNLNSN
jgi:mono/diheme cytochrome c family protein